MADKLDFYRDERHCLQWWYVKIVPGHYIDVIMGVMASQITSLKIVQSTVYSKRRSRKTSKLRVTCLWAGNSPVTGEIPAQRASNAETASIWWRHHVLARYRLTTNHHLKGCWTSLAFSVSPVYDKHRALLYNCGVYYFEISVWNITVLKSAVNHLVPNQIIAQCLDDFIYKWRRKQIGQILHMMPGWVMWNIGLMTTQLMFYYIKSFVCYQ